MTMYDIMFRWYEGSGGIAAGKSIMLSNIKNALRSAKEGHLQSVYTYLEKFDTAVCMYVHCVNDYQLNRSELYKTERKIKKLVWDVYYYHKNKVPV